MFARIWQLAVIVLFAFPSAVVQAQAPTRPNIVWIIVDDMSANFSCYGEKAIQTPHVDRLAREGTRFSHAYTTAPVCSPCRSALITGCYQTTIGAHHHRSGRGEQKIHLPKEIVPVPVLFQQAGYYTCIGHAPDAGRPKLGKTDYNFEWDPKMYDAADWSGRKPGQPFFMQVQLHGGKHRGNGQPTFDKFAEQARQVFGSNVSTQSVALPPYYPPDPAIVEDWARYLDSVSYTDHEVGLVLARLEREGILEQTVICFLTDHGISHARGKQFLYDEGIHVPLVLRGPGVPRDKVREDLVEQIDLAATSLALAGIAVPPWMQGKNLLAENYQPREAVFSARDRCDETVDHLRSVRTQRYKYIRNYLPARPLLQPNVYKDGKLIVQRLRALHAEGKLDALQERVLFADHRPNEELYDLQADPWELNNQVDNPRLSAELAKLRAQLADWESSTGDLGRTPESEAMYDSDMDVYLGGRQRGKRNSATEQNIELMKRWAREGR